MMLTRWKRLGNMWVEMQRLQDDMNRAFNSSAGARGTRPFAATYPMLNIWDDGENIQVEAELPGMELGDLEIYVNAGNEFTIKGERKSSVTENMKWHRRERGLGTFSRMITLPVAVDEEKVSASFTHGVLKVTLPKAPEVKPRRIQVNVA